MLRRVLVKWVGRGRLAVAHGTQGESIPTFKGHGVCFHDSRVSERHVISAAHHLARLEVGGLLF